MANCCVIAISHAKVRELGIDGELTKATLAFLRHASSDRVAELLEQKETVGKTVLLEGGESGFNHTSGLSMESITSPGCLQTSPFGPILQALSLPQTDVP